MAINTTLAHARTMVSEAMQQRIDAGIGAILSAAQAQARAVLQQHRELLERGAQELLDKETLDEDAIRGYKAAMGTRSSAPTSRAPVAA